MLDSLKTFADSLDCSESRIRISVSALLLCHRLMISSARTYHGRLSEQFSESPAAFGNNFLELQAAI